MHVISRRRTAPTVVPSPRRKGGSRRFHQLAPGQRGVADGGYVLIMTALLLVPLIAFTGFAVDVGSWYAQGVKMQRAADAAALAGVVWAAGPAGTCPSQSYNCVAIDTAQRNGFTITSANVTKISDSQISVSVTANANIFFAGLFVKKETLTRTATASYTTPVPMGSPSYQLGNDPDNNNMPQFWLNMAGLTSPKGNGDRFSTNTCSAGEWQCPGGTNLERQDNGYFYKLEVGSPSGSPLNINVYDPEFAYTGDACTTNMPAGDTYSGTPSAANLWTPSKVTAGSDLDKVLKAYAAPTAYPGGTGTDVNAIPRYDPHYPGSTFAGTVGGWTAPALSGASYCSGDQNVGNSNIITTYIVRAPDATPLDNTDNPIICAISFSPNAGGIAPLLIDTATGAKVVTTTGLEQKTFASEFHKYTNICSVPGGSVTSGDYLVQVRANASNPSSVPPTTTATSLSSSISIASSDDTVNTGGHNRFALQGLWGTALGTPATIGVFADGKLPIYVNVPTIGVSTSFYLARIPPQYAGKILQLNLWDIGDGGSPTLTIVPPPDATNPPTTCNWTIDGTPLPAYTSATISGCSAAGMTSGSGDPSVSGFNGRLTQVQMAIPSLYTCDVTNPNNCWFKININFTAGTPADTTTWSANILGDPVHLTQ